jgi:hypothetical protein
VYQPAMQGTTLLFQKSLLSIVIAWTVASAVLGVNKKVFQSQIVLFSN